MASKTLFFVGSALDDLRAFPEDARREAGHQLHLIQLGHMADDWKPMASVGPGVYEIRIHTAVEHRVVYIARHEEGVYVLHAFEKTSRRTGRADLDLARRRLKALNQVRRSRTTRK